MHEVLVNCLGGISLPRQSVVRFTDRPDMTLDVYRGRKTTMQQLFCMGRELIIQRSLARVRSSLYFTLNDVLFHPYPHDHFLTFPSPGSNPIGC